MQKNKWWSSNRNYKMMVIISFDTRSQLCQTRSLDQLAQKGQRRAHISAIRRLLQPNIHHQVVDSNKGSGSKKRLCGPKSAREGIATTLARMLSRDETLAFGSTTKLSIGGEIMANYYLKKWCSDWYQVNICNMWHDLGVTTLLWANLLTIKGQVGIVDKNLKANFVPTPNKVSKFHCLVHIYNCFRV